MGCFTDSCDSFYVSEIQKPAVTQAMLKKMWDENVIERKCEKGGFKKEKSNIRV